MNIRRVLVTGAQGFIGRMLIERLQENPELEIVAVGRRGGEAAGRMRRIVVDVGQRGWTATLPGSVDAIAHLAQSVEYQRFPEGGPDMVRVNVDSTAELLDWAVRNGVGNFVFTSTGSVYRTSDAVLTENSACEPAGMYAASKLSAEHLMSAYSGQFGTVAARLFGVYGPGQVRGIFRTLFNRVASGQAITVADGTGLRITPLFVADCAAALARLILEPQDFHRVYNVGGSQATDVREIVDEIAALGFGTPRLERISGSAPSLIADSAKLSRELGWHAVTSLKQGLAETAAWIRSPQEGN